MTPEAKAKELVNKFKNSLPKEWLTGILLETSKLCALGCCDEIINSVPLNPNNNKDDLICDRIDNAIIFWQQVKLEINQQ